MHTQTTSTVTQPQLDFIARLLKERVISDVHRASIAAASERGLSTKEASDIIRWLKEMPHRVIDLQDMACVPEGRFAIEIDGTLRFYVVTFGKGRWDGRVFVSRLVGDNEMRISFGEQRIAREAIAVDPREASVRFGRELGVCGVCGRSLTNEESREAGIGPVCRENFR